MTDRRTALVAARHLLGVSPHAHAGQVTRAYRLQARRLHPDVNPDADAAIRFQALQAAYRISLQAARELARDRAEPPRPPTPPDDGTPPAASGASTGVVPAGPVDVRPQSRNAARWLIAGPVHVGPSRSPSESPDGNGRRR
jgi:hypothetical protein